MEHNSSHSLIVASQGPHFFTVWHRPQLTQTTPGEEERRGRRVEEGGGGGGGGEGRRGRSGEEDKERRYNAHITNNSLSCTQIPATPVLSQYSPQHTVGTECTLM